MSDMVFTFSIKLDAVTLGPAQSPRTVEDGSSLRDVDLLRAGLGSSDQHARTAENRQGDKLL